LYAVVLLDDDYTPYDWVLKLLGVVFRKEKTEALRLAREVDETGGAKVGLYTRDLAETLCVLVHQVSQRAGHPLQARFERQ
jgi:ATP-dependent Clp protease adaptor protein ClpS